MRNGLAASLIAIVLVGAAPADAARLHHKSGIVKTTERGVAVWRRAAETPPAPMPERRVEMRRIAVRMSACSCQWPERGLRTQGFWSGDGQSAGGACARRPVTRGFYADRIAIGL